ncbi:MAG: sulfatase-like hydrolase/transferase [Actinomycetota bacterium]
MSRIVQKVTLAAIAFLLPLSGMPPHPAAGQASRPNILIILTDDQRATDTMQVLPKTLRWFADGGTTFGNAFATTPVCCPSRASIMTGRFAHNTGVLTNRDQALLNQDSTIQRYLNGAGYRTAVLGKFINEWPLDQDPPHFDRWAIMNPAYDDATFNVDGTVEQIPGYTTDVISDMAVGLLDDFEANDADPWFLFLNPYASHEPWIPEKDYENADVGAWSGNPAVFETDKRDKPAYVRRARHTLEQAQLDRQGQLRSLMSVDDLVDQVLQKVEAVGEQDTLAFFLSDNGFFWSEHGLTSKNQAYTQSIQIPMFMRWPGRVQTGAKDGRPVGNIDVVPTIMEATGVTPAPEFPVDGRSLLNPAARQKILAEGWQTGSRGPWASIRSPAYQYVEYYLNNGTTVKYREYYDLAADPWQLRNLFGDGTTKNDPFIGALHQELAAARTCVGASCSFFLDEPDIPLRCPGKAKLSGHHMVGSLGNDRIRGTSARDVICGRGGSDVIRGKGKGDRLFGTPGPDVIYGNGGNDRIYGKGGHDRCVGGPGSDVFRGCEKRRS